MTVDPYAPPTAGLEIGHAPLAAAPRLWNPDVAGLWSFLFTPTFGSVMVLLNWRSLGEPGRVWTALAWLVVSVLMLPLAVTVPGLGLLYLIVWYLLCQRRQTLYVKERWAGSYPKKSWLVPILGCVGVLIALILLWPTFVNFGAGFAEGFRAGQSGG